MITAAQTLDLTDEILDYMIFITDGFDGDLGTLQITSAAIAADDIQAIGIGFESSSNSPAILKSTLEEIAQGRKSNIFIANSAHDQGIQSFFIIITLIIIINKLSSHLRVTVTYIGSFQQSL